MADLAKRLGQAAPAATTETDLYTVPGATNTVTSSIIICNRGVTDATFRISLSPLGAATANPDFLYFDETVPANKTFVATIGQAMIATDVLRVFASTANLSFNVSGVEST